MCVFMFKPLKKVCINFTYYLILAGGNASPAQDTQSIFTTWSCFTPLLQ